MPKIDYRNTEYCKELKRIGRKKRNLMKVLKKEHPKTKIVYNSISKYYREKFYEIYNNKCSYCGASLETLGTEKLEIDHFIHESSFGDDKATAGKIENLVLSCYGCNRRKDDYLISERRRFHPDMKNIKKLFYRDKEYGIKVLDRYETNSHVKEFYEALGLGSEFRKLDYLILKMQSLVDELEGKPEKIVERNEIMTIYRNLQKQRNKINPLK